VGPSYADPMQRTFYRDDVLASFSCDFANLPAGGVALILNFAAAFDGEFEGQRGDAHKLEVTFDYRLYILVRGSASIDRV
jgi:hypothetical protein